MSAPLRRLLRNLEVADVFARHVSEVHRDELIDELDSELSRLMRSEARIPICDAPCEARVSTLDIMDWYQYCSQRPLAPALQRSMGHRWAAVIRLGASGSAWTVGRRARKRAS